MLQMSAVYHMKSLPIFFSRTSQRNLSQSSLALVHILFRHGHRTPTNIFSYPKDPYLNCEYLPYGPGQLTNEGKQASYNLGKFIRKEYGHFLGELYFPGDLKAKSTKYDRTQASLQLFLAGLYPPKEDLVWETKLNWQPIPYNVKPREYDYLMCATKPEYRSAYDKYLDGTGVNQHYQELYSYVEEHTGRPIRNIYDIWLLYFNLETQKEMGLELPQWTKSVYPEPFTDMTAFNYELTCATPALRKMALKTFTDKITTDTSYKLSGDRRHKINITSAHELNIAQLLLCLNSFEPAHVPYYTSCVILEIHNDGNEPIIRALYKRSLDTKLELLPMWGVNPCPFQQFTELLAANYK